MNIIKKAIIKGCTSKIFRQLTTDEKIELMKDNFVTICSALNCNYADLGVTYDEVTQEVTKFMNSNYPKPISEPIHSFVELVGETIARIHISQNEKRIEFLLATGQTCYMYHEQEYNETVYLEDVTGSWNDILNTEVLAAYKSTFEHDTSNVYTEEAHQWTFYTIATFHGAVTLRWLGESNSDYSMDVSFKG